MLKSGLGPGSRDGFSEDEQERLEGGGEVQGKGCARRGRRADREEVVPGEVAGSRPPGQVLWPW